MKPLSCFLLPLQAATSLAAGFRLEAGLENGLYTAHPDPTRPGQHIVKRHEGGSSARLEPRFESKVLSEQLPLPSGHSLCFSNRNFSLSDYRHAVNALFETPLFWMPSHSSRFALYGSAVAYICTLEGWNRGSLVEYLEAMDWIDQSCGPEVAACRMIYKWRKSYGRDHRWAYICANNYFPRDVGGELEQAVRKGCHHYVNGIRRLLGRPGRCNDNAAGKGVWQSIKEAFPWYKSPLDHHDDSPGIAGRVPTNGSDAALASSSSSSSSSSSGIPPGRRLRASPG